MGCNESSFSANQNEKEFSCDHEFEMYAAIVKGDKNKIENFINKGFKVDYQMPRFMYRSCLHIAAEYGQTEIFKYFLGLGAHINQKDKDDITPIFIACSQGHLDIVEICFQNSAKYKGITKSGLTLKDYIPPSSEKKFKLLLIRFNITKIYPHTDKNS